MAILSKGIKLAHIGATEPTGVTTIIGIAGLVSCPVLGGTTERVDCTDLSANSYHYLKGLQQTEDLDFTFLYDKEVYQTLRGHTAKAWWVVEFPDGVQFKIYGESNVVPQGGTINEALQMVLTITPESDITPMFPQN